VALKSQIRFKGPAKRDYITNLIKIKVCIKASRKLKTERTRKYVSISICGTTQPLGLRWGFETASTNLPDSTLTKAEGVCPIY
jgi:hypothetical protein